MTAEAEPVAQTVLRALDTGLERWISENGKGSRSAGARLRKAIQEVRERNEHATGAILGLLRNVGELAPVLLIIDEFGKNLEAFARESQDSDLFLLQEIAEIAGGAKPAPVFTLTLQHLAWDEYASDASRAQRREWAKIQGRFEDIAFVESSTQVRALIARGIQHADDRPFSDAVVAWSRTQHARLRELGIVALRLLINRQAGPGAEQVARSAD